MLNSCQTLFWACAHESLGMRLPSVTQDVKGLTTHVMESTKVQTLGAVALHTTTPAQPQVGYSLCPALSRVCVRTHVYIL